MSESIIITVITSLCTGGITWLFTIKYTRKQAEADAMKSLQDVYQQIIEDLKIDREDKKNKIEALEKRITLVEEKSNTNAQTIGYMRPHLCGLAPSCDIKIPFEYPTQH